MDTSFRTPGATLKDITIIDAGDPPPPESTFWENLVEVTFEAETDGQGNMYENLTKVEPVIVGMLAQDPSRPLTLELGRGINGCR